MKTSSGAFRRFVFGISGLLLAVLVCSGCSTSPWKQDFVETAHVAPLGNGAGVEVREVAWMRLQAGLHDLEASAAKSDVAPADWSADQRNSAKAKLLKTLQVSEEPAMVHILGRTDFRTTQDLRPDGADQPDLVKFAREIGANRVIWSRRLTGKADTIIQEPVTTWTTGFDDGWGRRRGHVFSGSQTAWVPVRVQADSYAYVAYFLQVQ